MAIDPQILKHYDRRRAEIESDLQALKRKRVITFSACDDGRWFDTSAEQIASHEGRLKTLAQELDWLKTRT